MSVQFTIRSADLGRLRAALDEVRPPKDRRWIIFLEVTPCVLTIRFGDKELQYPVDGKSPGFAKFPEGILWQTIGQILYKNLPAEIEVEIREGYFVCHMEHAEGDIEVGYFRYPQASAVFYVSTAELATLGTLVADPAIFDPHLQRQIAEASDRVALLVGHAAYTLRGCGVTQEDISGLVNSRLAEMKPSVKARFDSIGMNPWKS